MSESNLSKVCGIVLHFRTEQHTKHCIASLISEGLQWILLIDNSEDNGASIKKMEGMLKQWHRDGIRITVVSQNINLGFSAAVNQGVMLANNEQAEAILLMNSDAFFKPGSLPAMYKALSKVDIVTPTYCKKEKNFYTSPPFYDYTTGIIASRPVIYGNYFLSGCCLLGRIKVFIALKFDEDFFFYGEDVEFSNRLKKSNFTQITEKNSFAYHDSNSSSINGSLFYEYHTARGHLLLAFKLSDSLTQKIIFVSGRVIFLPARAIFRSTKQKSLAPIAGLFLAIIDLIMKKRRTLTPQSND